MQDDPTARKIKHLEMIQGAITRMADNSATMKRYAIVSFTLGSGMARYLNMPEAMGLVVILVVIFWYLDAKYLQQEKWFRDLYDEARHGDDAHEDFLMTPSKKIRGRTGVSYGLSSWSTRALYLPALVIVCILWWYLGTHPQEIKKHTHDAQGILQLSLQTGQLASLSGS